MKEREEYCFFCSCLIDNDADNITSATWLNNKGTINFTICSKCVKETVDNRIKKEFWSLVEESKIFKEAVEKKVIDRTDQEGR